MKFTDMLKSTENEVPKKNDVITEKVIQDEIVEKEKEPEEILRGNGFKIKLVTGTAFGKQIDFAKKYDEDEIKEVLKDYTVKFKGKSVFIVD